MADKKIPKIPIIPLGDRILVELIVVSETPGGIVLPQKQGQSGYVRAIGTTVSKEFTSDLDKSRNSRGLMVGDKVFLVRGQDSGVPFKDGDVTYLLVNTNYISAIVNT